MVKFLKRRTEGGCLGELIFLLLLFAGICVLGATVRLISQPQDLSDIGGYGSVARPLPARDMKAVLKNSIERGYPLTLTETEINQWLGRVLVAKQGGLLAGQVSLEHVWVRLDAGQVEVVMERRLMGRPFTVSMFLRIEQLDGPNGMRTIVKLDGGPYLESLPKLKRGGCFGRVVVPQGFLVLVLPAYQKLATVFADEIHLGFEEMLGIKIEEDSLVLNPRVQSSGPKGSAAGVLRSP
jgi:hypothetical protein